MLQILTTIQAFEELLRANDIDYYMGQSFREQLAQNIALAQRVVTKISGRKEQSLLLFSSTFRGPFTATLSFLTTSPLSYAHTGERAESHDDKAGHELLALR